MGILILIQLIYNTFDPVGLKNVKHTMDWVVSVNVSLIIIF